MSQKVSRKSAVTEEKEKSRTQSSPVKEMKKKMAANAEKEKQAAEKATDKNAEKTVEKPAEKTDKTAEKVVEKSAEKADKNEKPDKGGDKKAEKLDKNVDKKAEKQTKEEQKKNESQPEKSKAESSKEDKSGKPEKADTKKAEPSKAKQNGRDRVHNGVSDVTLGTNGTDDVLNGTVKATRTPETPRPASDKQPDKDADDPKDKVLKLKEDATSTTDRRLRSSDSPKPQEGKKEKVLDSPKKSDLEKVEENDEDVGKGENNQEMEVEGGLDVPGNEGEEAQDKERSKTDTNFSKSRVKVSPYRRSMRIADQTNTSLQANYTGNNTTMEMDITESSSFMEDAPLDDSSYLRGLRSIRGRSSYKPLKEITLRHVTANKSARSTANSSITSVASVVSDGHPRPTGTVVGRKRKPDADDVSLAGDVTSVGDDVTADREGGRAGGKRMRVLERLAEPFRRVAAAAGPGARRNAEIVGINTDLPLTAPVSSAPQHDPESLKHSAAVAPSVAVPLAVPLTGDEKDNKRCVIM